MKYIVDAVADLSKIESPPKMEGKTMMTVVAPTAHKKKQVGQPAPPAGTSSKPDRAKTGTTEKQEGQ